MCCLAKKLTVCGIDEVGRGCLAGPLVTAAVILPLNTSYKCLKDSKLLSEQERILAYRWIQRNCWYGIGIVHNRLIDKHNIWQATLIGMKRALMQVLAICPDIPQSILIDAMPLDLWDTAFTAIPVHYFPHGERTSCSIAAASILAKVTRDDLIRRMDPLFPGYHLAQHKGYGTKKHKDILEHQTESIIHRNSFLKNLKRTHQKSNSIQKTIFQPLSIEK